MIAQVRFTEGAGWLMLMSCCDGMASMRMEFSCVKSEHTQKRFTVHNNKTIAVPT